MMLTVCAEVITEDITHGRVALCFADRDNGTFRRAKVLGARRRLAAGQCDSDELLNVVRERFLKN